MITSTVYKCTIPSYESMDHLLIRSVALLCVESTSTVEYVIGTTGGGVSLEQVTTCQLTGSEVTAKAQGWQGAIRLLSALHPVLALTAAQESWLEAVQWTLMPIVTQEKKDAVFEGAVLEFVQRLEAQLSISENGGVLCAGGVLTLADVCVCQVVCAVLQQFQTTQLLPAVHAWICLVLTRLGQCVPHTAIPGWRMFGLQRSNIWNDWIQAFTTSTTPSATTAAAAAPAEVAPVAVAAEVAPVAVAAEAAPTAPAAPAADAGDNVILKKLTECGIAYEYYSHPLCMTAEELVTNVPIPATDSHTKNLFLRDKKHGLFLITLHPDSLCNTKELGKLLGLAGKTNLRMADAATLDQVLHVKPGCVGPLSIVLVTPPSDEEKVTLILDQALLSVETIHSHASHNDASVKLTPAALQAFLAQINVTPTLMEFGKVDPNAAAPLLTPKTDAAPKKAAAAASAAAPDANKKQVKKGETLLALQWKKKENFPMWYSDVIVLSEMISYYDISGCYILRPWSYKMWELIQDWFNAQIQKLGVENAYFPMFVSQDRLECEKDHVEGFAPEVAWVTRSGSSELAKPIAIRPTSETIMYPAYSDWIQSHRDLPLKLNQWSNVVRWEFKYPTPFLRTREFLWQEGHTAHSTTEEANEMVLAALELYRRVYEELLAVPVVPGFKTEKEKFAGGYKTTTVEAYISGSGRAIQGATSHHLGQNFGKMFNINFQNKEGKSEIAWQTSWGLTTRTIGVMVMVHGDDTGLVLPPRVAPLQIVIVPIYSKKFTAEQAEPYCVDILGKLQAAGLRAKYDDRTLYNPGWKYNHWEQKGVPIRIEVGPRDVEQTQARIVIRHDGSKQDMPVNDGMAAALSTLLDEIQAAMFLKAKEARDSHMVQVTEWKDFVPNLELNNLVLTPWCGGEYQEWEETVKTKSREESLQARGEEAEDEATATSVAAKTLCIPFDQPDLPPGTKCLISGMDATCWILWGRSY